MMFQRTFGESLRLRVALILFSGFFTASCGNTPEIESRNIIPFMVKQMSGARAQTTQDPRTVLTPTVIASVDQPYLLAEILERQVSATLIIFNQSRDTQDWRSLDGISLVFDDGVLVATRGLGEDLFIADTLPDGYLLHPASQSYTRDYRYLDGENREVTAIYNCKIVGNKLETVDLISRTISTRKLSETCVPNDPDIASLSNTYWVDPSDGFIWQSRQFISGSVGYVMLSRLVR